MLQELSDILQDRVSPEMMTGISALVTALRKHEATAWEDQVFVLRMNANNLDPQVLVDHATSILMDQVEALFKQMRISIDLDQCRLDLLSEIIDCLVFEPSDLDSEILACIEAGEEAVDTFIEILSIVTNKSFEELMPVILEVPMATIATIQTIIENRIDNGTVVTNDTAPMVHRVARHQRLVGEVETIGTRYLQGDSGEIDPMEVIRQNQERLVDAKPDQLADDLLSIALRANVSNEALQDEVMYYTESFVDDIVQTQQVYKHVKSRLKQLAE